MCCLIWISAAQRGLAWIGLREIGPAPRTNVMRWFLGVLAHSPAAIVISFPARADGSLRGRRRAESCQRIACVSMGDVFDEEQACGSRWVCISR